MDDEDDVDDDHECTKVGALRVLPGRNVVRPTLIVVAGESSTGKTLGLGGTLVVGRHRSADFVLDEDGVSRKHALFTTDADGAVRVVDLGSTNGTYVNGKRVESSVLRDGDKIVIGTVSILKFSYLDAFDEALQRNLYDSATRDSLTRAYNRRHFDEALPREVAFARRHRRPLSIVLFDVDHFKKVNDTFGHPAGDHVLATLAGCVASSTRADDLVARIGGEEFAILLRDLSVPQALEYAERVRQIVASTAFVFQGQRIPVTISLGVAELCDADESAADFVAAADASLYAAKRLGRNRVELTRRAA